MMDASLFISSRLRFKGRMAAVCIAVSFIVMIVAVAVSSGFRREVRGGLAEISGDIQITPVDMNYIGESSPIERNPAYMPYVEAIDGISEIVPVVYRTGIVKSGENIHGIMLKGIPQMDADSTASLGVSIPGRLSRMLSLGVGDDFLTYFVGERVQVRKFKVVSVYNGIMDSADRIVVYARLSDMQRLNGWGEDKVSAFEVKLKDRKRSVAGMGDMTAEIGVTAYANASDNEASVYVSSLVQHYPQLFDWLNLIDFNVLFILVLMTIVAGVNMISGLLIMLFEHISTIGLLKSLGMTDRNIAKVFLSSASVLVLKGMASGNLAAIVICGLQQLTHIVSLNPANYFVSFLPVHLDFGLIFAADIAAYIVIMLLLLIPCLFISKVDPAKTVAVR